MKKNQQTPYIKSRKVRNNLAKIEVSNSPEKINWLDRRAFAKTILMENISELLAYRKNQFSPSTGAGAVSEEGRRAEERKYKKYDVLCGAFGAFIEQVRLELTDGNYKYVRNLISEKKLLGAVNDLDLLIQLIAEMLAKHNEEAVIAQRAQLQRMQNLQEDSLDYDESMANMEKIAQYRQNQELLGQLSALGAVVNSKKDVKKSKLNLNI